MKFETIRTVKLPFCQQFRALFFRKKVYHCEKLAASCFPYKESVGIFPKYFLFDFTMEENSQCHIFPLM